MDPVVFECSGVLWQQTDPGHCRQRTWIASDGLLYHFSSFSFSEDLFPFKESN